MKNIERPEFQAVLADAYCYNTECENCYLGSKKCLGNSNSARKLLIDWFNAEYKEPHHLESWELEILKHIDKKYKTISKSSNDPFVWVSYDDGGLSYVLSVDLLSLKKDEEINIDEELERNGMHR